MAGFTVSSFAAHTPVHQPALCKVCDQIRLQRIVHLCCELLILPHHASFVGALANIHAPAHKDLGLIAMQ